MDLKTSTITARLAAESNLDITRKKNATIEEEYLDGAEAELKKKLKQELEKEADSEQDKLREEVTEQLKKKLQDLQLEMDKVINKTTAAALKEKAAQLGEIEEISEDDSGSLTIKVRV